MKGIIQRTPFCCGLFEIGAFSNTYNKITRKDIGESKYAHICVTRAKDIKQKLWLRSVGFKVVGRWINPNTRHRLTLWAKLPEKKKKKKKKRG